MRARGDGHVQRHLARFRELDAVADDVDEHLTQPVGIADQAVGHVRVHVADQLQALPVRLHGEGAHRVAEQLAQLEVVGNQLELAGLDLRKIQEVVDQPEQAAGRRPHRVERLPLARAQRSIEHQLSHAEDGVHRGPDVMAHVGEELVLGAIGGLGGEAQRFDFTQLALCLVPGARCPDCLRN